MANPPDYLKAWPSVLFRRLGTNNHFRRTAKVDKPGEKEQQIPKRSQYPDHYYRKPGTDDFEWVLELKLCSVNGNCGVESETDSAVNGLKEDVTKWRGEDTHAFVLMAVNIPSHFQRSQKAHLHYEPEEFVSKLKHKVNTLFNCKKPHDKWEGVVIIKRIQDGITDFVGWVATPTEFARSPHRPASIPPPLL